MLCSVCLNVTLKFSFSHNSNVIFYLEKWNITKSFQEGFHWMVLPSTPICTAFSPHNISNTISCFYSPLPLPPPPSPSLCHNISGVYRGELCRVQQCRGQRCRAPGTQVVPLGSRAHTHHICQRRPHQPSTRRWEIFQAAREGEGEMVTLPILTLLLSYSLLP